ncbi:MAG: hypothetical protein AAFY41_09625, partial [Bacteroidota bacterium]
MNDRQTQALNGYRALKGVFDNYATEVARYNNVQEKVQDLLANQLDNLMIRLQRREPDLAEDYFN